MAANSFGTIFKITTWGESHGTAIGVVIDGCPAGLEISESEIQQALAARSPGKNSYTSPRKEADEPLLLSGIFEGRTTGAPISILIYNKDSDSSKYEPIKEVLRPGHANYTYLEKYGIYDYRGGGRASARETACRVAAGAIAKKLLRCFNIEILAYIKQIGDVEVSIPSSDMASLRLLTSQSVLFCPDGAAEKMMKELIEKVKSEGDSVGGIVEFISSPLPAGLGDPVYEKLDANLALAMMSIPASKGFELGAGFTSASMRGSEHNDLFCLQEDKINTKTNCAGGVLAGISSGMPLVGRVVFKPASTIMKRQESVNLKGESIAFEPPAGSRHDPCVAIRAVPVVEAMAALVLADALLLNRMAQL